MNCKAVIVVALFLGSAAAAPSENLQKLLINPKTANNDNSVGIYDGNVTDITKHPYMVGLLLLNKFICGGTILSQQYVLTIADCVHKTKVSFLTVVAGSKDGITGTVYKVKRIIQHPQYDTTELDYDFSLIQIKGSFSWSSSVGYVSLPNKAPAVNDPLVISGYGYTKSSNTASSQLHDGTMFWQKTSFCKHAYSDYMLNWTSRMGCTFNKNRTTACSGDFGGPYMKDNTVYALAVAVQLVDFCSANALPVISAVVYPVVDWIETYIN